MLSLSRWKIILVLLTIILGAVFTLPNLLPKQTVDQLPAFMPKKTLNLGLDLQGGSYLLLEVDTKALRAEKLTNIVEDARTNLRKGQFPFSELAATGDQVTVRITDPTQVEAAAKALRESIGAPLAGVPGGRDVTVNIGDGGRIRIAFVPEALEVESRQAVEQSIEIVRRRVDELGTREPTILRQGANRIVVQAPGESDPQRLRDVIGKTAKLTFQMVDETVSSEEAAAGRVPPGSVVTPSEDAYSPSYLLRRRVLVDGAMLTDARMQFDQQSGQPVVTFRFDGQGSRRFGDATTQNIGKRFAIVLDGKVISAPVIQSAITGGSGQITGNFTPQSANDLSMLLRAGALPAPLVVVEQRTVGAELGADAVKAGQISTGVGFVAILVFMLLSYGFLFGGIAVAALLVNGLLILGVMSMTQSTLTLPGIAGLILTLAVAVDANVLIYERMRDEVRAGRTVLSAMDAGFSRAMSTIIDANVTTLLAAVLMFQFGAGPVKGFAVTLFIGVLTSVFTAVLITQVLLAVWFRTRRPKSLPIT
jgi:preprotein translocase subunit SecD